MRLASWQPTSRRGQLRDHLAFRVLEAVSVDRDGPRLTLRLVPCAGPALTDVCLNLNSHANRTLVPMRQCRVEREWRSQRNTRFVYIRPIQRNSIGDAVPKSRPIGMLRRMTRSVCHGGEKSVAAGHGQGEVAMNAK